MERWLCRLLALALALICGCGDAGSPLTVKGKPVAHWLNELKSPSAQARKQAVFSLGLVGTMDEGAVRALIAALKDSDVEVRRGTVLALLHIGPPASDALPALERARNDTDLQVRSYAAKAIPKIHGE